MRKKIKISTIAPLLLLILMGSEAFAQSVSPVTSVATAESVLLNTDRSIYLPGDEILLSATIVEADNYKTAYLSRILNIEILNGEGTPIYQEKTEVTAGRATRRIKLHRALPSGWYEIRAYTNWMRNRDVDGFSGVTIRVVNPSALNNTIITIQPDSLVIRAIAAGGGNLIADIENRCAVRVTDTYGNPVSFSGALVSSSADTVAWFTSGTTGWASMTFTPSGSLSYRFAASKDSSPVIVTKMAAVERSGTALSLSATRDSVVILLQQTTSTNSEVINLMVHSLSNLYWLDSQTSKSRVVRFAVPKNRLPKPSIVQFSLLNAKGEIITQRLFLTGDVLAVGGNADLLLPTAATTSEMTATFESDNRGTPGNYYLTVRKSEPMERNSVYLQGIPGWPARYDIPLEEAEREAWLLANYYDPSVAESYLLKEEGESVNGSVNQTFKPATREEAFMFMPETRGVTISGKVTRRGTDEPVAGEILTLTLFSDNFLYTAATLNSGRFHFSLPGREGHDNLILSFARRPDTALSLTLFPGFDDRKPTTIPSRVSLSPEEMSYIRELALSKQLEDIYLQPDSESNADTINSPEGRNRFLDYPDHLVSVEEFIRLPNMREVIFEVVPFVSTRRENDRWVIKVLGEDGFPSVYKSLVLLDGIPLIEYDEFLELPPERIRRIEVINKLYIHGNVIFAGVVNFISTNNDLAGLDLPPQSQIISMKMPGLSEPIDIDQRPPLEAGMPDLSSLLKIQPFVSHGRSTIQFATSDNLGEYIFTVCGFTKEGRWVNLSKKFEVTNSNR
jgi:hypothetical protein